MENIVPKHSVNETMKNYSICFDFFEMINNNFACECALSFNNFIYGTVVKLMLSVLLYFSCFICLIKMKIPKSLVLMMIKKSCRFYIYIICSFLLFVFVFSFLSPFWWWQPRLTHASTIYYSFFCFFVFIQILKTRTSQAKRNQIFIA